MKYSLMILLACSGSTKIVEDLDADGFPAEQDCNDQNAEINPAATEICNGVDDNCDQMIDADDPEVVNLNEGFIDNDGDGFGVEPHLSSCDAVAPVAGDCDDENPTVNPYANEYCNDIDDN